MITIDLQKPQFSMPTDIDQTDLLVSLQSPSLVQQAVDQRVGSFDTDNYIRAQFLVETGLQLVKAVVPRAIPSPAPTGTSGDDRKAFGLVNVNDLIANCSSAGSTASPYGCVKLLDSFEHRAATARNQAVICKWARNAWMPRYTAIFRLTRRAFASTPEVALPQTLDGIAKPDVTDRVNKTDYGPSPGC